MAILTAAAATLLDAAKRGDERAFEILLRPVLQPAYRLAGGMLQDQGSAEDVVQNAAFKAWRKIRQLREGAEMRPWFLAIVANEARTVRRSRWSSVVRMLTPPRADASGPESVVTSVVLRQALRALDEKKRLALVLHWYLDLPVEEIATITRSSVHAVEGQIQRGQRELRRRLEDARA